MSPKPQSAQERARIQALRVLFATARKQGLDKDAIDGIANSIRAEKEQPAKRLSAHTARELGEIITRISGDRRHFPKIKPLSFRIEPTAEKRKMMAKLAHLLATKKADWGYADKMAQTMFKVDRVDWLNPTNLHALLGQFLKHLNRGNNARR